MKAPLMIGAIALLPGLFLLSSVPSTTRTTPSPGATARKQLVLVELFTSEGCSSCPPADTLLKTLSEQQPIAGVEIVAFEEHVDYWDQLGWKDPYSSSEFTERQTRYADVFRSRGVYTPQMVVDGHIEVVGSRTRQATEAIQRAASLPKAEIEMKKMQDTPKGKATYALTVGQLTPPLDPAKTELWVAVTEKSLQSDVKAGENAGERLQHAAVVRTIQRVKPARGSDNYPNSVTIDIKENWKAENLLVVAFLVDKSSRSVVGLGAASVATAN